MIEKIYDLMKASSLSDIEYIAIETRYGLQTLRYDTLKSTGNIIDKSPAATREIIFRAIFKMTICYSKSTVKDLPFNITLDPKDFHKNLVTYMRYKKSFKNIRS